MLDTTFTQNARRPQGPEGILAVSGLGLQRRQYEGGLLGGDLVPPGEDGSVMAKRARLRLLKVVLADLVYGRGGSLGAIIGPVVEGGCQVEVQ